VKWYELGRFSQGRAAEIAGLTRAGFIDALSRYKVSPFQYTAEEVAEDLRDAD
jgi:predicted HTH domain antitoxin